MSSEDFVKVLFRVTGDNPGDQWTETILAQPVGNSEFIIQSSPFQAYGVSFKDKIRTEKEVDGLPLFKEIVKKSGNSTYRVILANDIKHPLFEQFWKPLEEHGCSYQNANDKLISVNVPPEADIASVFKLLEGGAKFSYWDFEEADCAHQV